MDRQTGGGGGLVSTPSGATIGTDKEGVRLVSTPSGGNHRGQVDGSRGGGLVGTPPGATIGDRQTGWGGFSVLKRVVFGTFMFPSEAACTRIHICNKLLRIH